MRLRKAYKNDAGTDILLDKPVSLLPKQFVWVDLHMSVLIKPGYFGLVQPRSSAAKRGLLIANCPIDADYTGSIHAMVFNASNETINYAEGESFCQIVVVKCKPNIFKVKPLKQGKRQDHKEGSSGK